MRAFVSLFMFLVSHAKPNDILPVASGGIPAAELPYIPIPCFYSQTVVAALPSYVYNILLFMLWSSEEVLQRKANPGEQTKEPMLL